MPPPHIKWLVALIHLIHTTDHSYARVGQITYMRNNVSAADSFEARPKALHSALPSGFGAPSNADGSWDGVGLLGRTLRGRYWLTLALCLLAGAIGAAAGWHWVGPLYRSDGMVRIASALPPVIQPLEQIQPIPMSESYMEAQQQLITSRSLLEKALQDPIWDANGIGSNRPSVAMLAANLKVDVRPKSENLRISYTDPLSPVASAAVASAIAAYQNVFVQENQKLDEQRLQSLQDYRNTLTNPVVVAKSEPTPSPSPAPTPTVETPSSSEFDMPSAAKVAMVDPVMARLIDRRDDAGDQLKQASLEFGPNHPYVMRLTQVYQLAAERVEQHLNDYLALHADAEIPAPGTAGASAVSTPPPPTASMPQPQDELDRVNRQIELLKTESATLKRFEIVDIGDLPSYLPGRQIKSTVMGAGIGGGMVLAIMVLLGLNRTQYREYADVIEDLGKRLKFVAAVPDLAATSKPRYWAQAAQCIHYFRHKLDQNGSAYMVTSADWGDGRTSVVMSLALSLCGAGARTLVIDADLATRGLTRSLKMDSHPGFFEMLRDRDFAAPLNVPANNIAILPVGAAKESDGFSISAPAVAQLLSRLKAQFDVILIDAGPALSRVETCVMARQVDGVLLTTCSGQDQSLWARTLEELDSVSAVHGAVFNRIAPRDFDRSVRQRSGAKPNERSRPIAGPLANLGPLVRAVAMSLTQDIELVPVGGAANFSAKKVA